MIMTYANGKYRVNAESDNARELIKELAQCIKTLSQDLIAMDEENAHKLVVAITRDLFDVCPTPTGNPSDQSS